MSSRARSVVLAALVGCLAIAGAVAANVALLGIANHPHDRVGQLQLLLDRPQPGSATAPAPTPTLVVTVPRVPALDDAHEGPDD
jgi:hypothetical protein